MKAWFNMAAAAVLAGAFAGGCSKKSQAPVAAPADESPTMVTPTPPATVAAPTLPNQPTPAVVEAPATPAPVTPPVTAITPKSPTPMLKAVDAAEGAAILSAARKRHGLPD